MKKGAYYTSSYEEESQALDMILDWIDASCSATDSVGVFTDSQSLCAALLGFNPDTDQLRSKLRSSKCAITIQWIPGHSNIPGNELAGHAAKEATTAVGLRGWVSPNAAVAMASAGTPRCTSAALADAARRSESRLLYALLPDRSV